MTEESLFSTAEVAKLLDVAPSTARSWASQAGLQTFGRSYVWRQSDVDDFADELDDEAEDEEADEPEAG